VADELQGSVQVADLGHLALPPAWYQSGGTCIVAAAGAGLYGMAEFIIRQGRTSALWLHTVHTVRTPPLFFVVADAPVLAGHALLGTNFGTTPVAGPPRGVLWAQGAFAAAPAVTDFSVSGGSGIGAMPNNVTFMPPGLMVPVGRVLRLVGGLPNIDVEFSFTVLEIPATR